MEFKKKGIFYPNLPAKVEEIPSNKVSAIVSIGWIKWLLNLFPILLCDKTVSKLQSYCIFFFGRENIKQLILWCDGSFRISEINRTYWAWPIIIPEWQQNTSARGVVSLWTMSDPITKMKSHHEPVLKKNHCHSEQFSSFQEIFTPLSLTQ